MSLGGRVPADANELRRELADIRGRLDKIDAWRVGLRNMLAAARSWDLSPRQLADALHDAMSDELPDLTMRAELRIHTPEPPTERLTRLGGERPGLEREDDGA